MPLVGLARHWVAVPCTAWHWRVALNIVWRCVVVLGVPGMDGWSRLALIGTAPALRCLALGGRAWLEWHWSVMLGID